ncbi:MAG: HEPN domain-containing protein [Desulfurococcus sp.]|nr:HEPN domain-containing protein [Desulfurococcus sp.]
MSSSEEALVLKDRYMRFLDEARSARSKGYYDLACFLAEQALQLYLKYALLVFIGDYPRTHSVRRLLGEIARVSGSMKLEEFIKSNRVRILALEDSYLLARYFVKDYTAEDADDMIKLVEEAVNVINTLLRGES